MKKTYKQIFDNELHVFIDSRQYAYNQNETRTRTVKEPEPILDADGNETGEYTEAVTETYSPYDELLALEAAGEIVIERKTDEQRLAELKEHKLSEINTKAQQAMPTYESKYPDFEKQTFKDQESYAERYREDATDIDPKLQALADARGETVDVLVGKIEHKAQILRDAAFNVMSQRQGYEKLAKSAETVDDLQALTISYNQ